MKLGSSAPALPQRPVTRTASQRDVLQRFVQRAGGEALGERRRGAQSRVHPLAVQSSKLIGARPGRRARSGPLTGLALLSILWAIVASGALELLLLVAALVVPPSAAVWLMICRRRAARARAEAEAAVWHRRAAFTAWRPAEPSGAALRSTSGGAG